MLLDLNSEENRNITRSTHAISLPKILPVSINYETRESLQAKNYYDQVHKFINFLKNFNSTFIEMKKNQIMVSLEDLNNLLVQNSYKFVDSLNDIYKQDTAKKIDILNGFIKKSASIKEMLVLENLFSNINKGYIDASLFSIEEVNKTVISIKK